MTEMTEVLVITGISLSFVLGNILDYIFRDVTKHSLIIAILGVVIGSFLSTTLVYILNVIGVI